MLVRETITPNVRRVAKFTQTPPFLAVALSGFIGETLTPPHRDVGRGNHPQTLAIDIMVQRLGDFADHLA